MLNQSILVGRIVRDPEVNETENGNKVTHITLAVQRPYKNINGEYDTDFISCVLWKGVAETTGTNVTVTFTPTDTTNINTATQTFSAKVNKKTPIVTLTAKSGMVYDGSAKAANTATAKYNNQSVNLTYTYTYYFL